MKTILNRIAGKCMLLCVMLLAGLTAAAQEGSTEGKVSVSTTTSNTDAGGTWYAAPWVWIVGAAVFILLLVAIVRGGGRRAE